MIKKANISSGKLRQRLEREINNIKVLKHNHIVTYYESKYCGAVKIVTILFSS